MNTSAFPIRAAIVATFAAAAVAAAPSGGFPALLDDFGDSERSSVGAPRIVVDDSSVGGQSQLRQALADGALAVEGEIVPARGRPGWASLVFLVSADGAPADLSDYEGIRLTIRVRHGSISVSANSAEIDNFDYHAAPIPRAGGEPQELRIPFADLRRAWSEQTPLELRMIASVSIVAFGLQKGSFAYELDEIGFY